MIQYLISVAKECFNIGNFNSLMAILCAYTFSCSYSIPFRERRFIDLSSSAMSQFALWSSVSFPSVHCILFAYTCSRPESRRRATTPAHVAWVLERRRRNYREDACARTTSRSCQQLPIISACFAAGFVFISYIYLRVFNNSSTNHLRVNAAGEIELATISIFNQ